MFRSHLFALLTLVFLSSCSGGKKEDEKARRKQSSNLLEKKVDSLNVLLTPSTVEERLSRYSEKHSDSLVMLSTPLGNMLLKLYPETPLHRANFLRLIERGYYKQRMFHRVVTGFVAQAGGTDERLPVKIGKYRIPAEIMTEKYFHKKGALAMARYDQDNPNKESDSHEFYLVGGAPQTPAELKATGKQYGITFSPQQQKTYTTIGGAPHLDGSYTVFGEVVEGLEVMEKIIALPADKRGFPLGEDVTIELSVLNDRQLKQ